MYDYDLPVTEEALNASIARINSQSQGTNLYGVVRSHVTRVSAQRTNIPLPEMCFAQMENSFSLNPGPPNLVGVSDAAWKRVGLGHYLE